ncbi:hypothetical protein M514_10139 [Trichuris suis]|uniref:Oxidoreductase, short chain dehydrogenase/reductase family protein n=1 Tax=Trichuris suis TaxID=68888 RepID=A0A085N0E3_9BILA|nr:hypothetical protein M514_10139 [Trichuris suis]
MENDLLGDMFLLPCSLLLGAILLFLIRKLFKGKQFTGSEKAKGKVFVVTGANCGIGKQIARELNYRGAKVYMGCRSMTKADKAVTELVASGCSADRLVVLPLDLSSFESIDNFVNALKERETKLDGLVNNAGIMFYPKFQLTNDGHETTWQVNYLSNVVLCEKLLPLLEACEGEARIVFVSSRAHRWASSLNVDKIDSRSHWDRFATYGKSKIMYSKLLAEKLRVSGSSVTSNSCHPGTCNTHIARYTPLVNTKLVKTIAAPFVWFFLKTPKDGAQTPLYLLLSKEVSGVSGKYFVNMEQREPSHLAMDLDQCRQLYFAVPVVKHFVFPLVGLTGWNAFAFDIEENIMNPSTRAASQMYADAIRDAYSPAKTRSIRSQSEIDLQMIASSHSRHPADGHYTEADEVYDRGRLARIRAEVDCAPKASAPSPGELWAGHTTGTLYKPTYDKTNIYGNRRYYSRYDDKDEDYFDWDIDHAVQKIKEQRGIAGTTTTTTRLTPTLWEHNLFKDKGMLQGQKMISPYLFTKADGNNQLEGTNFLSSALRTPSYWSYRFEHIM